MISVCFQGKLFNISIIQVYAPTTNCEEAEVEWSYEDIQDFLELTPKKELFSIIGDWNAKVASQEISGVTGKFGLGIQNKAGQRLARVLPRDHELVIASTLANNTRDHNTHEHHQMVNNEIKLIIFLAVEDGEALYSQQKQGLELTVAQIISSL